MKRGYALLALLCAGCPSGDSNPPTLWLSTDGDELHVKLIDHEPPPF
jgi:hypothetical protein